MGVNINSTRLSKRYVLEKVSQITIFSTYLNLPKSVIENCIETGDLIISPLRVDRHPTCGFRYDDKGKLKFKDFSGFFWGDCFDLVAFIMSRMYCKKYDISEKHDFIEILRHITFTFKDIFYNGEKDDTIVNAINETVTKLRKDKPVIEVVSRDWNSVDKKYWKQFGVTIDVLNANFIYPVDQYYINRHIDPMPKYYYDDKDLCYAYLLGRDRKNIEHIKLYFPRRKKGSTRFITNCNHLEGIYNLCRNDYDIICITKSTKDRVSIVSALNRLHSFYGETCKIGVINIPHETYHLRENEFDWMSEKLSENGTIVSLMDNDETGKKEAIWLRQNYNITPLLIPSVYKSKDFSELVHNTDAEALNEIIIKTINNIRL